MKHLNLVFIFLLHASISFTQTPGFEWVHTHGGVGSDQAKAIGTDHQNNVYTTGQFNGIVDFDPGPGVTNLDGASNKVFIQKLNPAGNLVWAKTFPGTVTSLAIDPSDNIILGGYFFGTIYFTTPNGIDSISSSSNTDAFIVKMDPSGNYLWARSFGDPTEEESLNGLHTDDQGNIYSTGNFTGSCDFDPGQGTATLNSAGGTMDGFIHKLSPAGDYLWAKKIGGGGFDQGVSIAVNGNAVIITGWFQQMVDLDPGAGVTSVNSEGYSDIFLVSLSTNGDFNWAHGFGSIYTDQGFGVLADNTGDIYLTGKFGNDIDLDPGPATTIFQTVTTNFFILKLTAAGNFSWARTFEGDSYKVARSIALHPNHGVVIAGEFAGTVDFDCGTGVNYLTCVEDPDAFIVYLDQNGNYIWAGAFGNTISLTNDLATDITVDNLGNIYTVGKFQNTVDFDCGSGVTQHTSAGFEDIYIHKLNSNLLSMNENSLIDFKLYPNPSNKDLFISGKIPGNCHSAIYNSLGIIVMEKELSGTEHQLDIQTLSAGSYIIKLTNEQGSQYQTFIKTN